MSCSSYSMHTIPQIHINSTSLALQDYRQDVKKSAYSVCRSDSLNVFPVELVSTVHGSLIPVGPVHPVLEGGDGERMAEHIS